MKNLSLVTAKVVRENEQYAYKLVGKGEKYLVIHLEGEKPEDQVIKELAPFAKEYPKIESVILQKDTKILGSVDSALVFKVSVKVLYLDEISGKKKKITSKLYVFSDSAKDVVSIVTSDMPDWHISSISETKIIRLIDNAISIIDPENETVKE